MVGADRSVRDSASEAIRNQRLRKPLFVIREPHRSTPAWGVNSNVTKPCTDEGWCKPRHPPVHKPIRSDQPRVRTCKAGRIRGMTLSEALAQRPDHRDELPPRRPRPPSEAGSKGRVRAQHGDLVVDRVTNNWCARRRTRPFHRGRRHDQLPLAPQAAVADYWRPCCRVSYPALEGFLPCTAIVPIYIFGIFANGRWRGPPEAVDTKSHSDLCQDLYKVPAWPEVRP